MTFATVFRVIVATSFSLLLTGCLSAPTAPNLPAAPKFEAKEPALAPHLSSYRLQVGDVLDVKMFLNPELNEQVTVLPDGMISTAVAQEVPAYGRTANDLKQDLEKLYSEYLRKPKIAVIVRSFAPTRVYVMGEVNTPGEFITVGPNLTLLQAIARAGGIKNSADIDEVVILRRGSGEQPEVFKADYRSATTGEDPSSDIRLAAYDVVFIPRNGASNAYINYQQYIQQFLPAAFGLSYSLNSQNND